MAMISDQTQPGSGRTVQETKCAVEDLGGSAASDGLTLRLCAGPVAVLVAQPRSIAPKNISGIAMICGLKSSSLFLNNSASKP